MSNVKNNRNSNLEILRIISMIMIIISHYVTHGVGLDLYGNFSFGLNKIILCISKLGDLGVVIFILIFGYFYDKNRFKVSKFVDICIQTSFYSLIIYIIFSLTNLVEFSVLELLKNTIPVIFYKYWFITAYLIIYLLSPFINKFIDTLDRREFKLLLILLITIWLIIPMFFKLIEQSNLMYTTELTDLIVIYIIGAYLSKFKDNFFQKNSKYMKLLIIFMSLLLIISSLVFNVIGIYLPIFSENASYFFIKKSPLVIILAISLLVYFSNRKVIYNKFINYIASLVLGVYLIHDNDYMRQFLWRFLKTNEYASGNYLLLHMILSVICVFVICIFIESIRMFLHKKYIKKAMLKITNKYKKRDEKI